MLFRYVHMCLFVQCLVLTLHTIDVPSHALLDVHAADRANQEIVEDPEVAAKRAAAQAEEKRAAARAHGTPVTLERFQAWKMAYDAEMAAVGVLCAAVTRMVVATAVLLQLGSSSSSPHFQHRPASYKSEHHSRRI